jgi:hypothetical protein
MDQEDRAELFLSRIIAVTGAKRIGDRCVLLDIGKTRFYVYAAFVERLRDLTDPTCAPEATCFYLPNQFMPAPEKLACALLHLKNNPALFDTWVAKKTSPESVSDDLKHLA